MKRMQIAVVGLVTLVSAGPAYAQIQATGTNTVSSSLQVSATVAKAIRLTLSSGTQCTVTASGSTPDYTMSFGTVDALGITSPSCGAQFAPTTPGVTPAVYYSDYKLKPVFTSQSTTNNVITAYVSTNFGTAAGLLSVVQANTAPGSAAALAAMSTAVGAQTSVATNAASATEITRYIGVSVAPINGAGTLTGADSATITYTLTVS